MIKKNSIYQLIDSCFIYIYIYIYASLSLLRGFFSSIAIFISAMIKVSNNHSNDVDSMALFTFT